MANDNDSTFLNFASFLKERVDEAFQEVDQARLSHELFADPDSQRSILPLYFFLTRREGCRLTVRDLKKKFNCGSDTSDACGIPLPRKAAACSQEKGRQSSER